MGLSSQWYFGINMRRCPRSVTNFYTLVFSYLKSCMFFKVFRISSSAFIAVTLTPRSSKTLRIPFATPFWTICCMQPFHIVSPPPPPPPGSRSSCLRLIHLRHMLFDQIRTQCCVWQLDILFQQL